MSKHKNTLIQELKNGDENAFHVIYSDYYNALSVYLLKYTSNKKKIEDIVQDTFIYIWDKRNEISVNTSFYSYLYKIAYNKLIDTYRAEAKHNKMLSSYSNTDNMVLPMDNDDKEMYLDKLNTCICVLPPKCKDVFIANKISGKKYKEVALDMNISIKTVENHVARAYKILKGCMINEV